MFFICPYCNTTPKTYPIYSSIERTQDPCCYCEKLYIQDGHLVTLTLLNNKYRIAIVNSLTINEDMVSIYIEKRKLSECFSFMRGNIWEILYHNMITLSTNQMIDLNFWDIKEPEELFNYFDKLCKYNKMLQ
jgi:hypothetical protein